MKRIICVLIAALLIFMLAACGGGAGTESGTGGSQGAPSGSESTSKGAVGTDTSGSSSGSSTQAEYKLQNALVVSTDECSLTLSSIKDGKSTVDFSFVCENKTSDKKIMFSMEDITADGYVVPSLFVEEVAAGKKASETVSISKSILSEYGIGAIDELGLDTRIYDSDDWTADEFVEERFVLYPTGKTASEIEYPKRKTASGEQIVADNEHGTFVIYGARNDAIWGYTLSVFLQNKTDSTMMFSWDDTSVNGFMCDPLWAKSVPAGCCAYGEINFSKSSFESNSIEKVEEIEFKLRMSDYKDFMSDPYVEEVFTYKQ